MGISWSPVENGKLTAFQVTEENFGATEVLELVPNGDDINVNKSNR